MLDFLFGNIFRLTAGNPNQSYVELYMTKLMKKSEEMNSSGWMIDEFGQFENIERNRFL